MLSRRQFCQYLSATVAGSAIFDAGGLLALARADESYSFEEVQPDLFLLAGGGGNILLKMTGREALLIDAGVGALASELSDKLAGRVGQKELTLINTHHHADHIGGNYAVRKTFGRDIRVVAQQNLVPRVAPTLDQSIRPGLERMAEENPQLKDLASRLKPEDFAPSETFAFEHEVKISGASCQLRHFGPGHTDNDAVVLLTESNVLHLGDLVFNNLHPYVFPQHGATISGWQNSLRHTYELCDAKTVVVPGHGERGGREIITSMGEYFEQVQEVVAAAVSKGLTREEVAELKPEIHAQRGFEGVQHMTLTRVYDEMTGDS